MSDDDGFIASLRSGENEAEHHAADEIERLRAAMTEAVEKLTAVHYPGPDLSFWCVTCSTTGDSWPCISLMVADDLYDALKGTTDE